jgi:hypothetical protein
MSKDFERRNPSLAQTKQNLPKDLGSVAFLEETMACAVTPLITRWHSLSFGLIRACAQRHTKPLPGSLYESRHYEELTRTGIHSSKFSLIRTNMYARLGPFVLQAPPCHVYSAVLRARALSLSVCFAFSVHRQTAMNAAFFVITGVL